MSGTIPGLMRRRNEKTTKQMEGEELARLTGAHDDRATAQLELVAQDEGAAARIERLGKFARAFRAELMARGAAA